jgi:hypothetical protein
MQAASDLEIEQIRATITKLLAAAGKLQAEQEKLHRESKWYPWIAATAFLGTAAAMGKLFFGG